MNVKILTNKNWISLDKQIGRWKSKGYRRAGITEYSGIIYSQKMMKD
jgi:hypothetical protein